MADPLLHEAFAHFNAHRFAQAQAALESALKNDPASADGWRLAGLIAQQAGDTAAALSALARAVELRPQQPEFHYSLANARRAAGDLHGAIESYRAALQLNPDYGDALVNLGAALSDAGHDADALVVWERALALNPDDREALVNVAKLCIRMGRSTRAIHCARRALEIDPHCLPALANLASALQQQGRIDEAIACCRHALEIEPVSSAAVVIHSNMLLYMNCHGSLAPAEVFAEHRRWNELHAQPLRRFIRPFNIDRSPQRRLRIGYVSADLRQHAIAFFIEPILVHHDRERFEIFCYSASLAPPSDPVTQRLKRYVLTWRDISFMNDAAAADLIREDRIDILVDLGSHTRGSRLLLFARKPAPVQVTYLAYAATTGLETIDWRITDPHIDPPDGSTQSQHCEKLLRLPQTQWCYQPPTDSQAPISTSPPRAESHSSITFGAAPTLAKVTPQVLDVWADVLHAVPGSRLAIQSWSFADPDTRERFTGALASRNIDTKRITLLPATDLAGYFKFLASLDIVLDTFPFAGGTSTCHALWMGTPVVTLTGPTSLSRVGASILINIGLPDLIAQIPQQFVQIAAALASDDARRTDLRATLRPRMLASPLCDPATFTRHLEAAYHHIWQVRPAQ